MGVVSDALDAAVDLSTGTAEVVAAKWQTVGLVIVAVLAMLAIVVLFYMSPLYGVLGLVAVVVTVALLSQNDGDSLV
jgi:hypothetical protein